MLLIKHLALAGLLVCMLSMAPGRSSGASPAEAAETAWLRKHPWPRQPIPLPADLTIPRYPHGTAPFTDGETLTYDASWVGVPAAEAQLRLSHDPNHPQCWSGDLWINSSKAVDLIYRMRDYVHEDFSISNLRPRDIYILQNDKKRLDEWNSSFNDRVHMVTSVKRNRQGRTWVRRFSGGYPWGPFSGAMVALSQPLAVGATYTFDIFSGGNRYVFAFNVRKRELITTPLGTFHALRIEPSVVWLSEGKFLKDASGTVVWVSDDERHLPLRIETATFIGQIRIDLVAVHDAPGPLIAVAGAVSQDPATRR